MTISSWDPARALRSLVDHGVEFVVIGGLAAALHGSTSVTDDTDICYRRSKANLERLASALAAMGARLRGVEDQTGFVLDAKTLQSGMNFTFTTDFGSLDCLGEPAGVGGYEDLAPNAEEMSLDDFAVEVCSLQDLKLMKRAAGRPVDLRDVEILGALEQELAEQKRQEKGAQRRGRS